MKKEDLNYPAVENTNTVKGPPGVNRAVGLLLWMTLAEHTRRALVQTAVSDETLK